MLIRHSLHLAIENTVEVRRNTKPTRHGRDISPLQPTMLLLAVHSSKNDMTAPSYC